MYVTDYFQAVERLFATIRDTQGENIYRAGILIATSISERGVVHVMDTGHLLRHEAFYRAGGLRSFVPFDFTFDVENPVEHRHIERSAKENDALMARQTALALESSNAAFGDVMLINSNSGRTPNVIEMALQASKRGICTIGIASREQMERCEAAHSTGLKLFEVCDLCIDNCGPHGDAMVTVQQNEPMGPASGLAAAYILWAIQAEAVELLTARGIQPTILRSVHVGGEAFLDEQNKRFTEQGY